MELAIGLTFPGMLKDESVICNVCKKFAVDLNIIEASFSMSKGWAIIKVEGSEEELKRVFDYLESKNVRVERIKITAR